MKILATLTLLLALAVGCLGYVNYRQDQDISTLTTQMSALTEEVDIQHRALLSHKKAILSLRSDEKKTRSVVLGMLLYLKSEDTPKSEQNSYALDKSYPPQMVPMAGPVTY